MAGLTISSYVFTDNVGSWRTGGYIVSNFGASIYSVGAVIYKVGVLEVMISKVRGIIPDEEIFPQITNSDSLISKYDFL